MSFPDVTEFERAIHQAEQGHDLTVEQTASLIDLMLQGVADAEQVTRLLLAIRAKGEAVDELVGAAQAMRRHMTPIHHRFNALLDTCGTGGSGSGTFNISTSAAIVAAACGVQVAKHGNRKATSLSGSADVLQELGVAIECEPQRVEHTLNTVGLCFCFAAKLHPAMKHVIAIRRSIAVPTLFNLLGPLCNPAGATHQLLGTTKQTTQEKIAMAISRLGTQRAAVVCGDDGQDEVSLDGCTHVLEVTAQGIHRHTWTPTDFGLSTVKATEIQAANPAESAQIIRRLLNGELGPHRDMVLASTAAALWLMGKFTSLSEATQHAAAAIDSGSAKDKLDQLIATGMSD